MTAPSPASPASQPQAAADLESLILPLLDSVFGAAVHLTGNRVEAENLVQEAVHLACREAGTGEPGISFKAWFYRILTNCYRTRYRQTKQAGRLTDLDDPAELYLYCQTASAGMHSFMQDPAAALLGRIDPAQVAAALSALPDEYRLVATLYFMQDFSYGEIAEVLDLPVGTIRSRLHRSRRMLQKALWTIAHEGGIIAELSRTAGSEA